VWWYFPVLRENCTSSCHEVIEQANEAGEASSLTYRCNAGSEYN
jgi:hypothetical protein